MQKYFYFSKNKVTKFGGKCFSISVVTFNIQGETLKFNPKTVEKNNLALPFIQFILHLKSMFSIQCRGIYHAKYDGGGWGVWPLKKNVKKACER